MQALRVHLLSDCAADDTTLLNRSNAARLKGHLFNVLVVLSILFQRPNVTLSELIVVSAVLWYGTISHATVPVIRSSGP